MQTYRPSFDRWGVGAHDVDVCDIHQEEGGAVATLAEHFQYSKGSDMTSRLAQHPEPCCLVCLGGPNFGQGGDFGHGLTMFTVALSDFYI